MSLITATAFYEGYLSVREGAQGVSRIVRRAPLSSAFDYKAARKPRRNALVSAPEQHA